MSNDDTRRAVWTITDRVRRGVAADEVGPDCFVAHEAEDVVLFAGAGRYAEALRALMLACEAKPERTERPPVLA